ncbi:MAG: HDOD domain-containing protein [Proteobacteria bacterium]|nr:HDOD domain-containing protein [Pseudomonadota bacterium]
MSTHSSWIEKIRNLPVLPQVAMRVTERMQSPAATLAEISELIKSDPGLSARVLRLANSSYYSIPGGVSDVSKALQFLGFTTIAQIVLTSSVVGSFKHAGVPEFPLAAFWLHSFAVGQLAEITARSLQLKNPAEAFVGGLLHDVGKLILLEMAPEQLQKTVRLAREKKLSFSEAEKETGGPSHVLLGVELAHHWRLPDSIRFSIENHHAAPANREWAVIEWANLHSHVRHLGSSGSHDLHPEAGHEGAQKRLGLTSEGLKNIELQFEREFEKAGAILNGH